MNKPVTEAELQGRLTGQRVTPKDIEDAIVAEHYFTAADGVFGARIGGDTFNEVAAPSTHYLLTFCVLTLWNGFTVTGQSACADPNNYRKDIGERIAREDAVRKIWPLLGYELRSKLALEELLTKALNEPEEGQGADAAGPLTSASEEAGAAGAATNTPTDGVFGNLAELFAQDDGSQEVQLDLSEGVGAFVRAKEQPVALRLRVERNQVAERLKSLEDFIESHHVFHTLPAIEQSDMVQQVSFMRGYLMLVERRLARVEG